MSRVFGSSVTPTKVGTKLVLLAGFGGVLGLMALAGLDAIRALHQIEARNARITQDYLQRHRSLEQIRSSFYVSSTVVRDFLLDPNPQAAQASLASLRGIETQMDVALREYAAAIRPDEQVLLSELQNDVSGYWTTLAPAMRWTPRERKAEGRRFLENDVLPRRKSTLEIADSIAAINDQALSHGSRRSAELFLEYRGRLTGILALTLGIGLLLAGASISHTLRLERESRLGYDQLHRAQGELKKLSARLVEAQEAERRAISRELHDEIGQSLNALLVDLGNLAAIVPVDNEEVSRLLSTAKRLADESVKALRNMALLLRPSMLDDFGLVPALHWQAREVSRRTGIRIDVEAEDVPDELPEEHKTCVYRVVQEALHNSSRHAQAHSVRVSVLQGPERLLLTISDDGRGFDASRVRGLGLLGMEERVKHLGGAFEVLSWPGQGTELRAELPFAAHPQNGEAA
jgi:signal transduction histidine kinase